MVALSNKRLKLFQRGGSKPKCKLGAFIALGAAACVCVVQLLAVFSYHHKERIQRVNPRQRVFPLHEVRRDHLKPPVLSQAMLQQAMDRAQALVPKAIPDPSAVNQQAKKADGVRAKKAPKEIPNPVAVNQQAEKADGVRAKKGRGPGKSTVVKALFAAKPPISEQEPPVTEQIIAPQEGQLQVEALKLDKSSELKAPEKHEPNVAISAPLNGKLDHRKEKVFRQLLTPMYGAEDVAKMIALVQEQDPDNIYTLCRVSDCDTVNDHIRAFNPWDRDLYLCGELIKAQSSIEIVKPCHENTRVYENELPGTGITKMCLEPVSRQVVYPFSETIIESNPSGHNYTVNAGKSTCRDKYRVPLVKSLGSWQRTVWHHDGVIDITLEGSSTDTYQIQIPMHVHSKMLRDHVYEFRGNTSRVVVIVDPRISVSNPSLGMLHMKTSQICRQPKRIRVIKEGWKHHKHEKELLSHSETMLSEFVSPVQFFRVAHPRL